MFSLDPFISMGRHYFGKVVKVADGDTVTAVDRQGGEGYGYNAEACFNFKRRN